MLRPNLAFILFYDQWFTLYRLVNQNSVQSADLFVPAVKNSTIFGSQYLILSWPTRFDFVWNHHSRVRPALLPPDTTLLATLDKLKVSLDLYKTWNDKEITELIMPLCSHKPAFQRRAYQIGPEYVVLVKHIHVHWKSRKRYGLAQPNKLIK